MVRIQRTFRRGQNPKESRWRLFRQFFVVTDSVFLIVLYLHTDKRFRVNICGTHFGGVVGSTCCSFKAGLPMILIAGWDEAGLPRDSSDAEGWRSGSKGREKSLTHGDWEGRIVVSPPMNHSEHLWHTGSFWVWWETQTWLESQRCGFFKPGDTGQVTLSLFSNL